MDDVMEETKLDPDTMNQEDWNYVYSEGYDRLKKYLAEGFSVIVDCGNLKRSERETPKKIAESMDANFKLIYINISKEEAKERWIKNQTTKERDTLTDKTMTTAQDMFDEPSDDEKPILYNQQMDLDKWINENIT